MPSTTALARWIAEQVGRDKKYESLREMSRELRIPPTTLSRLKHGGKPSNDTLKALAEGLRLSEAEFFRMLEEFDADRNAHTFLADQIRNEVASLPVEDQEAVYALVQKMRAAKHKR